MKKLKSYTTFNWWEAGNLKILKKHKKNLNKIAEEHIKVMRSKGFTSGELPIQKYPMHNRIYTGHWTLKIEEI